MRLFLANMVMLGYRPTVTDKITAIAGVIAAIAITYVFFFGAFSRGERLKIIPDTRGAAGGAALATALLWIALMWRTYWREDAWTAFFVLVGIVAGALKLWSLLSNRT